ncbi:MAG: NAD(P)/FAD-dependent oxidoreductase [Chloroflexi bacterium]|nr:NAD(P)/FAD-dependent oxidoreductase [Chloroflexota bacterium]
MRVGIVGGGLAGLTAAYELTKKGSSVVLFEERPELGGQASTFEVSGARLERFYHHLFASDVHIVELIRELGLGDRLLWLDSKTGVFHKNRIYPFVSPTDLLRFDALSLVDRVRLGLLYIMLRRTRDWRKFEKITAKEWVIRHGSRQIYDVLWGPLLRGKFADSAEEVSMTWLWGKVFLRGSSRSSGMAKEQLGYLDGSFQMLIDALADAVVRRGGEIHAGTSVNRIVVEEGRARGLEVQGTGSATARYVACDRIIATVPSFVFPRLVPVMPDTYADKLRRIRYQTAVCVVLELSRPLSHIYWLNISDESIPFVGLIEHTNFIPPEKYGGRHIAYLSNYVPSSDPLASLSDEALLDLYLPPLTKVNPEFKRGWITRVRVQRDPAGQPVVTTSYAENIPEHRTPISGLYLANTTQIYPEDRGMNYSVRLGERISRVVWEDVGS